jgi:hypothetical protein
MKHFIISTVLIATSVVGMADSAHSFQTIKSLGQALSSSSMTFDRSISNAKSRFLLAQSAPLTGEQEDTVKKKSYMKTKITISNLGGGNGRIDGLTRIWTDVKLAGFTGGVDVSLVDENQSTLHITPLKDYGVNGKWIGESDRTERWSEILPPGVVDKVKGYVILHRHTPKGPSRLWGNIKTYGPEIVKLYKDFKKE